MATNQTGIAITIKAFLPIGKDLDQQLAALTLVKSSHETGDYAPLLAAAKIDEVKTEQKTRRVEEARDIAAEIKEIADHSVWVDDETGQPVADGQPDPIAVADDADIPQFLKTKKPAKAA